MASIYFCYNELLRQSADQAVANRKDLARQGYSEDDCQQKEAVSRRSTVKQGESSNRAEKYKPKENQAEDCALRMPFTKQADVEATLAALQPRMNRLVYLQPSAAPNLDVLARSLGPKL
ncbi:hypothetical protein PRIC1_004306 [Phytophthora ramorum]